MRSLNPRTRTFPSTSWRDAGFKNRNEEVQGSDKLKVLCAKGVNPRVATVSAAEATSTHDSKWGTTFPLIMSEI